MAGTPKRRNIPVSSEVHQNAKDAAELLGLGISGYVETAITQQIKRDRKKIARAIEARKSAGAELMKRVDRMT